MDIPLIVTDGKSDIITFSGEGLSESSGSNTVKRNPKDYPDSIPVRQLFDVARQSAALSLVRCYPKNTYFKRSESTWGMRLWVLFFAK